MPESTYLRRSYVLLSWPEIPEVGWVPPPPGVASFLWDSSAVFLFSKLGGTGTYLPRPARRPPTGSPAISGPRVNCTVFKFSSKLT